MMNKEKTVLGRVKRKRWPMALYVGAQQLLSQPGATAKTVADGLALDFEPAPAESTIREWVRDGRITRGGSWTVAGAPAEEARLVLPILAGVIEHTKGAIRNLTTREAEWIAKLRQVSGELMPAWPCYQVAGAYVYFEEQDLDTAVLDHYLAFANWRKWPMLNERYRRATEEWGIEWLGFAEGIAPPPKPWTDVA